MYSPFTSPKILTSAIKYNSIIHYIVLIFSKTIVKRSRIDSERYTELKKIDDVKQTFKYIFYLITLKKNAISSHFLLGFENYTFNYILRL